MVQKSLTPSKARSTGIAVAIMALLSACSSQSSERSKQDSNASASRGAANLAVQAKANEQAQRAQAKDDALLFVSRAQDACRVLTRKVEALTTDSTVDFSELNSFIPVELYPTDPFAAYVNERAVTEVKSQLTQLVGSVVELLRSLERSQATSAARIDRPPDDAIALRAAFQEKKLKMLASIDKYCESVRAAGAGVGALR